MSLYPACSLLGSGQIRGRLAAVSPHAAGTVFPRNWKKKRTHSTNWCVPINEPNQRMNEWMNESKTAFSAQTITNALGTEYMIVPCGICGKDAHSCRMFKNVHVSVHLFCFLLSVCYSVRLSGRPSISACFPHSLLQIVHCQSATAGWLFHFSFRLSVRLS